MQLYSLVFNGNSRCTLAFEESHQWLRATWHGHIDAEAALRAAQDYLTLPAGIHCPYLLNDNTNLRGPWFDSLDWLLRTWAPQAARMGLRYVAHVVQTDSKHDTVTDSPRNRASCLFELQFFDQVAEAEEWLRSCQAKDKAAPPPAPR